MHGKRLDAVLSEDFFLAAVDVSETDVHEAVGGKGPRSKEAVLLPFMHPIENGMAGNTGEESAGHAVDVARVGGGGRVDVCMGIDPDDAEVLAGSLPGGAGGAPDGADGDGVVAAEGEGEAAVLGFRVDLLRDAVGDGRDGEGTEHVVDWGVGGRDQVGVVVHLSIVANLVIEILVEVI